LEGERKTERFLPGDKPLAPPVTLPTGLQAAAEARGSMTLTLQQLQNSRLGNPLPSVTDAQQWFAPVTWIRNSRQKRRW
jgi:hypothetical protein